MRRVGVLITLSLVLATGASASPRDGSGLFGTVTRGPLTPVCMEGQTCSGPAASVTLRFDRNRVEVAHLTTSALGTYRIRLASGTYTVRYPKRAGMSMQPTTVSVPAARWKHQNFSIDTGIR